MEIVPIPPICLIQHAFEHASYQFALVHECEKGNGYYIKPYIEVGKDPEMHLILDNGAFEMGASDTLPAIIKWANVLHADEVVLPDRMFMADETVRMSKRAMKILPDELAKKPLYQGVVHGRNHKEWLDCAYALYDLGIDVLAIPKDYEAWPGGREVLLAMVQKIGLPVHLLGMEKDYWSFPSWRCKELVRSMDTAKPYIMAHNESLMWSRKPAHSFPRPGDYFNKGENFFNTMVATENLMRWETIYNK